MTNVDEVSRMTKWDKLIIVGLALLSFTPHLIMLATPKENYATSYASVLVDGKETQKIPLTGQLTKKYYEIETKYGKNTLVVENETIASERADCPDQVCKEIGYISKRSESIVCLPNHLYVEIKGQKDEADDVDIRAY